MGRRIVEKEWNAVAADILVTYPQTASGYEYVLFMQDLFTRWMEFCPLRRDTGPKIREAFKEIILMRYGTAQVPLTDNGTEFLNFTLREFITFITFIEHDHIIWDQYLSNFRFAFNTTAVIPKQ